ncbi:MAG: PA14 domain-containing protein, partial [Acidobacteria bacterium]|nr:PA14 domain-containing protein [Acidobacteriota bacterium]
MVRDDGNGFLNFDFGTGSPNSACGIGVDNFSARWTRTVNFAAGVHRFTVTADDGVRLYVDDVLRLDKWIVQEATTYTVDVNLTAGNHSIKMEYFENTGFTAAKLSWELLPCVATVAPGNWRGEYFNNKDLNGAPAMVRNDGAGFIDFDFGSGSPSPACGIGADNFSARWTRTVNFSSAGNFRFTVTADDGVRLFVDNQLLLDKWFDQVATTYPVDVSLTAGNHTLRLEHFENGGLAVAKLSWSLLSVLAANQSTTTECAEEDNVNIPLTGQIASFIIEATHPTSPVPPDNCAPDFSNCPPALSGFSFTPGVFKLFDDGETVVEAVREASWWRPNGMAAAVDDRPQAPDAHYVRIYRRIADTSEYPQVLVLYQDGALRLIPQPPVGASSVCFGSSVIIGPAAPAQRPIAEI